jgi:hypothetical protein
MPWTSGTIILGDEENSAPGTICTDFGNEHVPKGTRASANTSGPDFTWAKSAGEIADLMVRTERRKLVSSAGPVLDKDKPLERSIQPFDLMSRRHPLSSTEHPDLKLATGANRPEGSCDVPASSRRQFSRSESYFFFLATLRVFFAVFFTALFAFFAFLAFLAMMPSDVSEMA